MGCMGLNVGSGALDDGAQSFVGSASVRPYPILPPPPPAILCSETLSAFTMDFSFFVLKDWMNHRVASPP